MSKFTELEFEKLYKDESLLNISSLIPAYLDMNPLAHPNCKTEVYSEAAMEYFLMRLPKEIALVENVQITANRKELMKFKDIPEYKQIFAKKRKRVYFFSKSQKRLIIGINSISDLNDIIPILTGLLIEIGKLRELFLQNTKARSCFSQNHLNKLSEYYGCNTDVMSKHFTRLSKISDFKLEVVDADEAFYKDRANHWMDKVFSFIHEKVKTPKSVYVVFSNSHSMINILSSYTRKRKGYLLDWANRQPRYREFVEKINQKLIWEDDALYYIQRAYFEQNGKEMGLLKKENEASGIFRFEDADFDGPIFHVIDLSKLNPDYNDSRIFDNAINKMQDCGSILINVDFTMGGYQAYYVLLEILERFSNIKGLYIFGKAGSMEGNVGDVILPGFTNDHYQRNYIFYKNDLKSKYLRRYLRNGEILESHGMLTVPGVLLQNYDYLNYYYLQSLTGIEMEGGAYLDAIIYHMKKNHFSEEILHLSSFPFDFGIAYYVSDTPYHEGKTLGTLDLAGLESVYALSVAVMNRILIKEASIEIN